MSFTRIRFIFILVALAAVSCTVSETPVFRYTVSIPEPESGSYRVELHTSGWDTDTLVFRMPVWMPGYYQIMDYGNSVIEFAARDGAGRELPVTRLDLSSWEIAGTKGSQLHVSYEIQTGRKFVAVSSVDNDHAYILPANTFLYVDGFLDLPVSVSVDPGNWSGIATGLEAVEGTEHDFTAPDFDILYDCPILIADLEELPPFYIDGARHRFTGYALGEFDRDGFMEDLEKVVAASIDIIGHIPYDEYTFIAIGPGRGGIEHKNNTTVSFDGSRLNTPEAMNSMMSFLAHEYFHHYNVKRIRPYELRPFDYSGENRTYLLWISEGLTVYYQYIIMKRAGLVDKGGFFSYLESSINAVENNPGRHYQSLAQASYNTWEDGPFGTSGDDPGRSISIYQKGPLAGLCLDLAIRHHSKNEGSLDDVMRYLYYKYYLEYGRGFTGAEFQQVCEKIAGASLNHVFEYVYTTKELNYNKYLNYAGLVLEPHPGTSQGSRYVIRQMEDPDKLQSQILESWLSGR